MTREDVHIALIEAFGWTSYQIASMTRVQQEVALKAATKKLTRQVEEDVVLDNLNQVKEYQQWLAKQ